MRPLPPLMRRGGPSAAAALLSAATVGATLLAAISPLYSPGPVCAHDDEDRKRGGGGRDDKDDRSPGRLLLRRMVQAEMTRVYLAREATFRADGPGMEQWVKHDPKRGIRRESIRPAGLVLIDNFKNSWRLPRPGAPYLEGESFLTRKDGRRIQDLVKRIKAGRIEAEVVGEDRVAGRSAEIVQVSGGRSGTRRKFWVDKETGLRLRTEEVGRDGRVLSGSYYLSLDLSPSFSDADFAPPQGARVVHDDSKRFPSFEEATKAGVRPRRPGYLPAGFNLRVVEVGRGGKVVTQRYANGLNVVSLSESREGVPGRMREKLGPTGSGFLPMPRGQRAYVWSSGPDLTYYLIGSLSDEEMKRIADSVR